MKKENTMLISYILACQTRDVANEKNNLDTSESLESENSTNTSDGTNSSDSTTGEQETDQTDNRTNSWSKPFCQLIEMESTVEYNMSGYSGFTTTTNTCNWTNLEQRCDSYTINNFETETFTPNNGTYYQYNQFGYVTESMTIDEISSTFLQYEYDCSSGWCKILSSNREFISESDVSLFQSNCMWEGNTSYCDHSVEESGISTYTPNNGSFTTYNDKGYATETYEVTDAGFTRVTFSYECGETWCALQRLSSEHNSVGGTTIQVQDCTWTTDNTCMLSDSTTDVSGAVTESFLDGSYQRFNDYGYLIEQHLLVDGFVTHQEYVYENCE